MGQKPGKETKKDSKSAKNGIYQHYFVFLAISDKYNIFLASPFDPETVKRLQEQTNCK